MIVSCCLECEIYDDPMVIGFLGNFWTNPEYIYIILHRIQMDVKNLKEGKSLWAACCAEVSLGLVDQPTVSFSCDVNRWLKSLKLNKVNNGRQW